MSRINSRWCRLGWPLLCVIGLAMVPGGQGEAGVGLSFEQMAALRSVDEVAVAPGGSFVAYTLNVPRRPGVDPDGPEWRELHVVSVEDGADSSYISGAVKVSRIRFSPDGRLITYLAKRDGENSVSLWAIPLAGGESRRLVAFDTDITDYRISPSGKRVAFVARKPKSEERVKREAAGYSQEVFEEDWLPTKVWLAPLSAVEASENGPSVEEEIASPEAIDLDGSAFHVRFSPDGRWLAIDVAPRPLIDDEYMFRRVTIVDSHTGELRTRFANPGKLGDFEFSPDGRTVAMISAADPNDPMEGRLMVAPSDGGPLRDLLPDLEGHVTRFVWRDASTLIYVAEVGVETLLGEIDVATGDSRSLMESGTEVGGVRVPFMQELNLSPDGLRLAIVGDSPQHPKEVWSVVSGEDRIVRLTDSNPWLDLVELMPQEVFRYQARDGLDLEGILIRPELGPDDKPLPLIMVVHGGPEGHRRNGWLSKYSAPGQVAAARGYAVFYPNYRGSTGRGVKFSRWGQGDAAGKEFEDLIDSIDALAAAGIVDEDRVGVTGGSYGGYATAWLATRYTDRIGAGVMFVGISNKISKGLTTDIPVEDVMVHTRFQAYTRWQFSLERSPIFYVEQCRTPLLIAGGTADTRVHPSQSLQLYRALKLVGKTPVRYVRYPGEEHGNRRAASRDDYARRLMRWMDHFVKNGETELPPWELDYDSGVEQNE